MKLVVHIGAPKAGSTAIQQALANNREHLLRGGVLYPRLRMSSSNHTLLTAGIYKQDMPLGRLIRPRVEASGKSREEIYRADVSCLKEQIAEYSPSLVILSSEAFFRSWNKMRFEAFLRDCGVQSQDVSIVCYLRNPADRYLSLLQQGLKHSSTFKAPGPYPWRGVLEGYMSNLPGRVNIRLHERGVDVVDDFMSLVAPEVSLPHRDRKRRNESVSAEIMQIVQDFRRANFPDSDNVRIPQATSLWRKLRRIEMELGEKRRPKLKPHVRQHILAMAEPEIAWLNARLETEVDWLKELSGPVAPLTLPSGETMRVADVCEVDADYMNELRERAAHWKQRPARVRQRRKARASKPRKPVWRRGLVAVFRLARRMFGFRR